MTVRYGSGATSGTSAVILGCRVHRSVRKVAVAGYNGTVLYRFRRSVVRLLQSGTVRLERGQLYERRSLLHRGPVNSRDRRTLRKRAQTPPDISFGSSPVELVRLPPARALHLHIRVSLYSGCRERIDCRSHVRREQKSKPGLLQPTFAGEGSQHPCTRRARAPSRQHSLRRYQRVRGLDEPGFFACRRPSPASSSLPVLRIRGSSICTSSQRAAYGVELGLPRVRLPQPASRTRTVRAATARDTTAESPCASCSSRERCFAK